MKRSAYSLLMRRYVRSKGRNGRKHKAFGTGQVQGNGGSKIIVSFKGVKNIFQFPGAFEQGSLKLEE